MQQNEPNIDNGLPAVAAQKGITDFSLIIARLEKQLLAGENVEACRSIIRREDVWRRLGPDRMVSWARLAQMAGEVETALTILAFLNQTQPESETPWTERLELLFILNRREQIAGVLAAARAVVHKDVHARMVERFGGKATAASDNDMDAAFRPFENLRHKQEVLNIFMELFSGRQDCFARQWVNKGEQKHGYVPVRRPIEAADIDEHLSGRRTYGIYLMKEDATVKTAALDMDLAKEFRTGKVTSEQKDLIRREQHYLFSRIKELSAEMGLSPLVEYSGGKGFHFWFLFDTPVDAAPVRKALEMIRKSIAKDVSAFHLEVFPKQDRLSGKGFGNLVKLPLGVHRATGKRSFFMGCNNRTLEAQLDFLAQCTPCKTDGIFAMEQESAEKKIALHPRWQHWAEEYPELFKLESLCPPLGQLIATCRNGAALSLREEKVLLQTVGFLPRAKMLVHYLAASSQEYNSHLVDYKLSRLRGTPLGCKRIHSLLGYQGDLCAFKKKADYPHPLLHLDQWQEGEVVKSEKIENLSSAIEHLKSAIQRVEKFLL